MTEAAVVLAFTNLDHSDSWRRGDAAAFCASTVSELELVLLLHDLLSISLKKVDNHAIQRTFRTIVATITELVKRTVEGARDAVASRRH